jgi:hypothetical protein
MFWSREQNSVGKDIACNMQGPGFEPWYTHLFTSKGEVIATRLLDQKTWNMLCLIWTSDTSLSPCTNLSSPLNQYVTSHLIWSIGENKLMHGERLVSLMHHRLGLGKKWTINHYHSPIDMFKISLLVMIPLVNDIN